MPTSHPAFSRSEKSERRWPGGSLRFGPLHGAAHVVGPLLLESLSDALQVLRSPRTVRGDALGKFGVEASGLA